MIIDREIELKISLWWMSMDFSEQQKLVKECFGQDIPITPEDIIYIYSEKFTKKDANK